jgi:hypothetical protein
MYRIKERNKIFTLVHKRTGYNPVEEEIFTCGVIYLFISSVHFQLEVCGWVPSCFQESGRGHL